MYSIGDIVRNHAKIARKGNDTSTALRMLKLENIPKNYGAANLYASALEIIIKLQDKIKEMEKEDG